MKKLITLLVLIVLVSCMKDDEFIIDPIVEVPENLFIGELQGVKLASYIVNEEVDINIKLPKEDTYRVKIRHGVNDRIISQELVQGKQGDNLLKVYVRAIPNSAYKLEVTTENHQSIGFSSFAKL